LLSAFAKGRCIVILKFSGSAGDVKKHADSAAVSYRLLSEALQVIHLSGRVAAMQEHTTVLPDACIWFQQKRLRVAREDAGTDP